MWGPGPWMGPMWGVWWIVPVIGLLIFAFLVIALVRVMGAGGRFMCMGPHDHDSEEIARLRREVEELREHVKKQRVA
jgi:uncharacterized membrane protein